MTGADNRVAADVRALIADLLPLLAPHAMLDADTGLLVLPVGTAHADISLDSITATCAATPAHTWPTRVQLWLAEKAAEVTAALAEREGYGPVEQLLRAQVTPRLPDGERERLMCTPYGDLLDIVIVLDHPNGGWLTRERAEQLAVTDPGTRALANTLPAELSACTVTDRQLTTGGPVRVIGRPGSPYVTSALLDIERFLPGPCPSGLLIALPRYSEILLHPVHPASFRSAARALADLARRTYADANDPCSDRLLWWAQGSLYALDFSRLTRRPRVPRPLRALIH
ncbi:hypothetical protein [Streptantibioticus ferralitis]|uniref:Uncharacterized protein n=1 Tax=Streptantibioticus ferralitis TaxID=236510 RepID=A0ABT5Z1E4_9ACTN|nr:hypothetical protein [Streptantibioticus ferralitis]MDF2257651.1 hypothetical protein [Streptantibioticus ferralitis]